MDYVSIVISIISLEPVLAALLSCYLTFSPVPDIFLYLLCFVFNLFSHLFHSALVSIFLSPPLSLSCSFFLVLLQLFKEELTQVKEGMKHINDLAHQLAISDVHLSMENARALEHLNSRWKVLQVEFTAGSVLSV